MPPLRSSLGEDWEPHYHCPCWLSTLSCCSFHPFQTKALLGLCCMTSHPSISFNCSTVHLEGTLPCRTPTGVPRNHLFTGQLSCFLCLQRAGTTWTTVVSSRVHFGRPTCKVAPSLETRHQGQQGKLARTIWASLDVIGSKGGKRPWRSTAKSAHET